MSGHRPARTRLIAASILGTVTALATFVVILTVRYRDGLEQRLRTDLTSGAGALRAARTPAAFKSVIGSLAAEGISVDLARITAKGGTPQTPGGALLTVHELIQVGGRELPATLTGSRAGIDRQVRSLEVTEAIGGAIALALLAALARVLVLLDRAASEARASEESMRTFLADASHELRTPVAALQATAERLLRDQPARPARDAIEAQLARDGRRLGHLIDDLLNLARLDARERPHQQPVDLADLASAAVAATRTTDSAARIELLTAGPVPAAGDHDALLRAVRNLLDNAFAVADTVVVEVAQTANGPTMSVSDNGPGVPADQRERIFEPFVRLPRSPRDGTGLGLAIVRRTLESHGGTITCDPTPTGGARFTLRLPANPLKVARPQPDPSTTRGRRVAAATALAAESVHLDAARRWLASRRRTRPALARTRGRSPRGLGRGRRTPAVRSRGGYADAMPMPKRSSVDDFFAQLNDLQRPHIEALRELSREADPEAREELKWNLPVYVRGKNTSLWMLQNFKNHCSLRFPPPFFATQMAAVEAAGYEAGKGFIKLPYDRELPTELLRALLQARVEEYEATGAGWNDR